MKEPPLLRSPMVKFHGFNGRTREMWAGFFREIGRDWERFTERERNVPKMRDCGKGREERRGDEVVLSWPSNSHLMPLLNPFPPTQFPSLPNIIPQTPLHALPDPPVSVPYKSLNFFRAIYENKMSQNIVSVE